MFNRAKFSSTWLCSLLLLGGCVSPVAMHRAVLEYDRTVSRVTNELLLLNIARVRHYKPIHFTAVSSIAATFDFRVNSSITGIPYEAFSSGTPPLTLTFGSSAAENPTVSIIPIQGEQFTKRVLTPISESKLAFLAGQGIQPAIILRLVARGILLDGYGEEGFLLNMPHRIEEYREFRRRILHLSALALARHLHFEPVRYLEGAELVVGRSAITNYSLDSVTNEERKSLLQVARPYPGNYIIVDIRPSDPGGDYPLRGAIKLRSFKAILGFIGRSISEEPEFHVDPDPRTGPVLVNPPQTLAIRETPTRPDDVAFAAEDDRVWYSVDPAPGGIPRVAKWNQEAFDVLQMLFQMTVTDVSQVPTPAITIAK